MGNCMYLLWLHSYPHSLTNDDRHMLETFHFQTTKLCCSPTRSKDLLNTKTS